MPIVIPEELPAFKILERENVFIMSNHRAETQDIRPIEIAILNLMPTKIETETQLIRLLANSPLQVNITLIQTATYQPKNTSAEHMEKFYRTFDEIKTRKFDGLIVTGAPVETLDFEEVYYWKELTEIFDYAKTMVTSTIYICWGAQAALYHFYNIKKEILPKKLFGIFKNTATNSHDPLLKGLDDSFYVPHSRYTTINYQELKQNPNISILARGTRCGISIAKTNDNSMFFLFGHTEYDRETLKSEYLRDIDKGLDTSIPSNYFINGDQNKINMKWNSTGNLIFYNWLNYYVYQVTPYTLGV
ncbi:MAG: homoserine O-succinyltransferase [Christensenellaceae bacterium]|jgi:homoserine O-succinyltransferase|nr:homoserine O-succinyltransferase [Christensenellaceae bacterium]